MRPLPALSVQTEQPRRSRRRRARDARSSRVELRIEEIERASWITAATREGYLSLSDWIRDKCNRAAALRTIFSADRTDWNTPQEVLDALRPLGGIRLDPCSNRRSIVRARVRWGLDGTKPIDGLATPWSVPGFGFVFVNPPYGDELPAWIDKALQEARAGNEIVLLVASRTDTRWFDRLSAAATVAMWRGRLRFLGAATPAPFPVCLAYLGRRRAAFRQALRPFCTQIAAPRRRAA